MSSGALTSSRNVFSVFHLSFSYNQAQHSLNVPKYFSRIILQDFERFPKDFDWKYACYVPTKHPSSKQIGTFSHTTRNKICLSHCKQLFQLQMEIEIFISYKSGFLDMFRKRSAGKKPSKPNR